MDEKIYTIDQVAQVLNLHPRTVRRFVREGKLNAHKVGGQWRVTEKELKHFSGTDKEGQKPGTFGFKKQSVTEDEEREKVRVSAVVDIYRSDIEEYTRISNTLIAVMNSKDPDYGQARCDHIYNKDEGRAQFILWGRPFLISQLLNIIQEITK